MKKLIIFLSFLFVLSIVPSNATHDGLDSLRIFLEFVHEDSLTITKIMNSPETTKPLETIETYLTYNVRLKYDANQQQMEWCSGLDDSIFVTRCAYYLKKLIVNDTAMQLVKPCLLQAYTINLKRYSELVLLECAEQSIVVFHAREAITIPKIYYGCHQEVDNRLNKLHFYEMVEMILLPPPFHVYTFGERNNKIIDKILIESNEDSPYYTQFRNLIDSYSDIELARITKNQQEELVSVLLQGVTNGEKKAKMTYAFMLQTGQFVEKNEKLGNELLSDLLSP